MTTGIHDNRLVLARSNAALEEGCEHTTVPASYNRVQCEATYVDHGHKLIRSLAV
jgi:hypothetical protein